MENYARSLRKRHPDILLLDNICSDMQETLETVRVQLLQVGGRGPYRLVAVLRQPLMVLVCG